MWCLKCKLLFRIYSIPFAEFVNNLFLWFTSILRPRLRQCIPLVVFYTCSAAVVGCVCVIFPGDEKLLTIVVVNLYEEIQTVKDVTTY